MSGIQNNAYENTYIYIQFCVCVRGRQSVTLPVCVCVCSTFLSFHIFRSKGANQMIHFKYSLSYRRQLWLALHAHPAHTHTRTAHTHKCTQLQSRLFVKLTEKRHRRCRRRCRRHPILCPVCPSPFLLPRFLRSFHPPAVCRWGSKQQQTQRPKSACFPFPCVFQFRSLLLPVTSVCSFLLSFSLYGTVFLLCLSAAAADCVCFIDFHSPTSFHSLLTILFSSLAARCKQKLQPVFHFSYYSAQTISFISILFLFVYVVIIGFRCVNK